MVTRKNIGQPVNFQANPEYKMINGVLENVKNGVAVVRYWFAETIDSDRRDESKEGFVAYLDRKTVTLV